MFVLISGHESFDSCLYVWNCGWVFAGICYRKVAPRMVPIYLESTIEILFCLILCFNSHKGALRVSKSLLVWLLFKSIAKLNIVRDINYIKADRLCYL